MTPPVTTEAFGERKPTRRTLIQAQARRHYEHVCRLHEMIRALEAAHQQVTAERDEAREDAANAAGNGGHLLHQIEQHVVRTRAAEAALAAANAELAAEREAHAVSARERNLFASELARLRAEGEDLRAALEEAEACLSIVPPRSDTAEYLRTLEVVRTALARAATAREGQVDA